MIIIKKCIFSQKTLKLHTKISNHIYIFYTFSYTSNGISMNKLN